MPKKQTQKILSWSYSRLRTYKQCPQLAKFKFIDKLPEPSSPALDRGNECHQIMQDYVESKRRSLPKDLKRHEDKLKDYRKLHTKGTITCEEQWAWNKKWKPVDWFAKDAWLRVKMDLCQDNELRVFGIDHKTGKFRPGEYDDQLLQYCVAMLLRFPNAQEAKVGLLFHDVDAPQVMMTLKRQYLEANLRKLEQAVEPMLNDTRFAPTPGPLCKWCNFSKDKGGPCKVA